MNWTDWCCPKKYGLVSELIDKGLSDLKMSCIAFHAEGREASLFPIQQAVEKYLKALLVARNPVLTEEDLRSKKYGHKIVNLFNECRSIFPEFEPYDKWVDKLNYDQGVRYRKTPFKENEVFGIINLGYAICHRATYCFKSITLPATV